MTHKKCGTWSLQLGAFHPTLQQLGIKLGKFTYEILSTVAGSIFTRVYVD